MEISLQINIKNNPELQFSNMINSHPKLEYKNFVSAIALTIGTNYLVGVSRKYFDHMFGS